MFLAPSLHGDTVTAVPPYVLTDNGKTDNGYRVLPSVRPFRSPQC